MLIAEIQESSNLTYRLFDYDRIDSFGNKRELHIDKAINVMKLSSSAKPKQPMRVLRYQKGWAQELLGRCEYFQVERILLNTEEGISIQTNENSFQVLLCIDGECSIDWKEEQITLQKGKTVFIPANSKQCLIKGNAQLLKVES